MPTSKNMIAFRNAVSVLEAAGHVITSQGCGIARCTRCQRSAYVDDGAWGQCLGKPLCKGPGCTRAAVRNGLCHAHSAQAARGTPLHPLRPVRPALLSVSLRVSAATREAILADVEGARAALEAWAKRR